MEDAYKISNKEKNLLELLTKIVLNSVDENGSDILVGKYNKEKAISLSREKNSFDKLCRSNINSEPDLEISLSKYTIHDKEYYHIGICSNKDKYLEEDKDIVQNVSDDKISENKKINVSDRQLEILKLIKNNPFIRYDEIKEALGLSKGTISIEIKVLKRLKILERVGTIDGKWIINKSLLSVQL